MIEHSLCTDFVILALIGVWYPRRRLVELAHRSAASWPTRAEQFSAQDLIGASSTSSAELPAPAGRRTLQLCLRDRANVGAAFCIMGWLRSRR